MVPRTPTLGLLSASLVWVVAFSQPVRAQGPDNVLLVINEASVDSVRVGEHYARARGIPQQRVVRLRIDVDEEIDRRSYEAQIETPLAAWLSGQRAQDSVLFIVLTKGVPLRIAGTTGRQGTVASVDSELTLLYRKLAGKPVPPAGFIPNPYFLGANGLGEAKPFTHERLDYYLVTRLDGFTAEDAIGLVDRAQRPATAGRVVLDMKAAWTESGNSWLRTAADRLRAMTPSRDVRLDETAAVVTGVDGVLAYYSWGSNDTAVKVRDFGFRFVPGAIAAMFVSTDGRTFKEPPAAWMLGSWSDPKSFFAGSPQSLTGDLIRAGVTGVAGHVAEPYLDATIRPEILFPAYLSGFSLAEAYYLAMPYLSWQTVVVGDPLCAVATRAARPSQTALGTGSDPETELPTFFSARRLEAAAASNPGSDARALKLLVKAESRLARRDQAGAVAALVEATSINQRLGAAHLMLGNEYERQENYEQAAERYALVLKVDASNVIALNNLAYLVAVHQARPIDALIMAERAYTLSKGNPMVADTLAWVHHLAGHKEQAFKFALEASRGVPQNAEVQLHGAVVFLAAGQVDLATRAYQRLLALNPKLLEGEEGARLRAQLDAGAKEHP